MHNTVSEQYGVLPPALTVRTHIPGREELAGDALAALWYGLSEEGIAAELFYDGGVRCAAGFAAFMSAPDVYCYAVYTHGTPVALTWLNNFSGRAAMIHFAVFGSGLPYKTAIGRYVTGFLLHGQHKGTYCLDALYGMTPKSYPHVLRFIRRLGFRVQGTIPSAVRVVSGGTERHVDGVISVCTRESRAQLF